MRFFIRIFKGAAVWALFSFFTAAMGGAEFSQSESGYSVKFSGKSWRISRSGESVRGQSGEMLLPVDFENGAKGLISSRVLIGSDFESLKVALEGAGVKVVPARIPFTDAWEVAVGSPEEAIKLAARLSSANHIRYAHPDIIFPLEARNSPFEEPYFTNQWNLRNSGQSGGTPSADIGVEAAWQVTTGSPETIVAVLDLGFDQTHKDLAGAWYRNPGEIPENKKDDDGNGLIDDVSGWNFSTNSNKLIYGAAANHGMATAGIIGARANGIGITGVCPGCAILPVVVSGRVSEDAAAIGYAASRGATVMSNSWGYALESPRTDIVTEALSNAALNGRAGKGIPILFAMHNADVNDCRPQNPDISAHPHVFAVSSIDSRDVKVQNSAWGSCLAFLGPSSGSSSNGIPATDRPGAAGYNTNGSGNFEDLDFHNGFWGTSAATPQVAGLFALLLSAEPGLTREQALSRMKTSAIKANPEAAAYDPNTGHSPRYGYGRAHGGKLFRTVD